MRNRSQRGALRAAALLLTLLVCTTAASVFARGGRTSETHLAAVPSAPSAGIRLARGFAHLVQLAKDAVAAANAAEAAATLDAARRLAIVLDATASVPGPTTRLAWIAAVRAAIDRADFESATQLLGPADERTLAEWAAPEASALPLSPNRYVGATVVDAVGAEVGRVAAVRRKELEIQIGTVRVPVPARDVFAASSADGSIVAAPTLNPRALRVCSDPNNLPFSNEQERGFENELAKLLAKELGAELEYTWWPARRGFLKRTLQARRCDVVMGLPTGFEHVLTSKPLYRSSYVFVYGPHAPHATSVEASELRNTRIGVPLMGDDGAAPPAVDALVRHGLAPNLKGYSVYGDYRQESPPAEIIRAVSRGDVDLAVAWGPLAGYYASRATPPLTFGPLTEAGASFAFDISLAVRRDDQALLAELEAALQRRRADVAAILDRYHVPRTE